VIKREEYLNRIRPFYNSDLIKIIIGMRRSGKSVLLKQIEAELMDQGIDETHIIYLNFEDLEYSFIVNENDLHSYIKSRVVDDKMYYLMFDKIQNIDNFEKAINSFRATMNCSVFLTGPNGKLLSGELATYLSGRYVSFRVMPFSFLEMCKIKGLDIENVSDEVFM
jgi:hypothetical protein